MRYLIEKSSELETSFQFQHCIITKTSKRQTSIQYVVYLPAAELSNSTKNYFYLGVHTHLFQEESE